MTPWAAGAGETTMTLREKILVGLMMAAVLMGALILMRGGPDGRPSDVAVHGTQPLTQMLTRLAAQFDKGTSLESSRYTLALAQSPWQETLFLVDDRLASPEDRPLNAAGELPANVALVYSGYIETSGRRVAIINEIEYVVGDQLDQSSYTLRQITPQQVVVSTPQQRMLAVPLSESWEVVSP
jgi:hypothetical protein